MQDDTNLGVALAQGRSADAPAPKAFGDLLQEMSGTNTVATTLSQTGMDKLAQHPLPLSYGTSETPRAPDGADVPVASSQAVASAGSAKLLAQQQSRDWPGELPSVPAPALAQSSLPVSLPLNTSAPVGAALPATPVANTMSVEFGAIPEQTPESTITNADPIPSSAANLSTGEVEAAAPQGLPPAKQNPIASLSKSAAGTPPALKPGKAARGRALTENSPAVSPAAIADVLQSAGNQKQTSFAPPQTGFAVVPIVPGTERPTATSQVPAPAVYSGSDLPQGLLLITPDPGTGTGSEAALPGSNQQSADSPAETETQVTATTSVAQADVPATRSVSVLDPLATPPGATLPTVEDPTQIPSKAGAQPDDARRMSADATQLASKPLPPTHTEANDLHSVAGMEGLTRTQPVQPKPQQAPASVVAAKTQSSAPDPTAHAPATNTPSALPAAPPLQFPEALRATQISSVSAAPVIPPAPVSPDRPSVTQAPTLPKNMGPVDAAAGSAISLPGTTSTLSPGPVVTMASPAAGHSDQPAAAAATAIPASPPADHSSSPLASSAAPKTTTPLSAEPTEVPSPTLTHARLLQTLNGSQMQVNLNTEDFGRISVHAGYSRDALTAQITLDSAQLGSAITAHLPGAEQKLSGDHGLRTAITVATAASTGGPADNQSGADQRGGNAYGSQRNGVPSRSSLNTTDAGQLAEPGNPIISSTQASSNRLNVTI